MYHCNICNFVQEIFSVINPVLEGWPLSHPAKDIGTMGFLFPVCHDWSGGRF